MKRLFNIDNIDLLIPRIVIIVVFGIIIAVVAGICANNANKIDEGYIIDKTYNASSTHYSSDKNGGHLYSYPAQYFFTIQGRKDGKEVEYTFEVTQTEYESYKIGDWYKR